MYNFFGSSPLKNQWRVLYGYMKEQGLLDSTAPGNPSFSHEKHNVMCSELKQLYVAITRTRQRLWICENIEEFSKPMFDYWKKMCLVQVTQLDESLAHEMRVASTPEEWKATGIKVCQIFSNNNMKMTRMHYIIESLNTIVKHPISSFGDPKSHHAFKGDVMSKVAWV